jgi:hypothetical protein
MAGHAAPLRAEMWPGVKFCLEQNWNIGTGDAISGDAMCG